MKLFLAGTQSRQMTDAMVSQKYENALASFFYIDDKHIQRDLFDRFPRVLIDSGGYSARKKGVDVDIAKYAEFLNKFSVRYAFNLDVKDIETSLKNQEYLEKNTKTYILPVYHPAEYEDLKYRDYLMDMYVEKYHYISFGGSAGMFNDKDYEKKILDFMFNKTRDKVAIHGLGITNDDYMTRYPFYSVDSTSWLAPSRFGRYTDKKIDAHYELYTTKERSWKENLLYECRHWRSVEEYYTRLWKAKGIEWRDFWK